MQKDFTNWHNLKSKIHTENNRAFFHEREVWWCSLGFNVGFEMDGKGTNFARPVLIIKVFNKEIFICLPLTTKDKQGKYYLDINLSDGVKRKVILSQIRLVDAKRLHEKIGIIDKVQFSKIKQAVLKLLE
jgi:mRNA interferase MazF